MPKLYVLIGVPGSGKSTWVKQQDWTMSCAYISTDKFVDAYAYETGKTYSEVFKEIMPKAVELMANEVVEASAIGKDIIWDQTSTSKESRKKKFTMLPHYYAIAVYFRTPERAELDKRLASRIGKNIPKEVVDHMINTLEEPTEEEGFKEIWIV